jgi:uncharacterized protein YceK|tara:strand:+ start:1348 stop:1566 length:219 start_codon:yes stop_codon:yes gene_type:complete
MKKLIITTLFAGFVVLTGCSSTPTYTVITTGGDEYFASTEPYVDSTEHWVFKDKKGKQVKLRKDTVDKVQEN